MKGKRIMTISGIGATPEPQNPQNTATQAKEEEKQYSIFDNAPQDGNVSKDEQKTEFAKRLKNENSLIELCKKYKVNIDEFFNSIGAFFDDIKTDNKKKMAEATNKVVEARISNAISELRSIVIDKFTGLEKQPPSITTKEGLTSEECIDYIASKIAAMGLDFNAEIFADVFARYDYSLSGEDSIISPNELYNEDYTSKYMNHDFEGNIKDTHALDYLVNVYAKALEQEK